jgi:hypothetical protein
MGVQKHYKKRFAKNRVEKVFTKTSGGILNRFFQNKFNCVSGRLSVSGVQKQH